MQRPEVTSKHRRGFYPLAEKAKYLSGIEGRDCEPHCKRLNPPADRLVEVHINRPTRARYVVCRCHSRKRRDGIRVIVIIVVESNWSWRWEEVELVVAHDIAKESSILIFPLRPFLEDFRQSFKCLSHDDGRGLRISSASWVSYTIASCTKSCTLPCGVDAHHTIGCVIKFVWCTHFTEEYSQMHNSHTRRCSFW